MTSLNGEPEQGLLVEAVGQEGCSMYLEETKTEADGRYRIRGLEVRHLFNGNTIKWVVVVCKL